MLNKISMVGLSPIKQNQQTVKKVRNNATNVVSFHGTKAVQADKLAAAYRAFNGIRLASTISFTGSAAYAFDKFKQNMTTCKDESLGMKGEEVGKNFNISNLASEFREDLPYYGDAIKTDLTLGGNAKDGVTSSRVQFKKGEGNILIFEAVTKVPVKSENPIELAKRRAPQSIIKAELEPNYVRETEDGKKYVAGTGENVYLLVTKAKPMAVIEDGNNVLLTNAGEIAKKTNMSDPDKEGKLKVSAKQFLQKDLTPADKERLEARISTLDKDIDVREIQQAKQILASDKKPVVNKFTPFEVNEVVEVREKEGGSEGGGTELVIGLEAGRFVPEIIDSIEEFCRKVDNDEIVLDKFVPAPNADKTQIAMLAGGFGSRAEYTNASSSKIMHGKEDGSNLTKGCFRTATGLTPMETTFISLHKAGLLDCSKGNLGIGKNIKFYLNDSGKNGGNGGFTVDMYDTMAREGRDNLMIFPNDSMSRIPNAIAKMNTIMNSGKAAMVMVAKQVAKEDARGALGIMKIDEEGKINAFDEKPKEFKPGYVDEKGNCFANTFQFQVSKEAFEALELLDEHLPSGGKEPKDWSKTYTPILMAITQNEDPKAMQEQIKNNKSTSDINIPTSALEEAKAILGDQQIYAVKTDEPWADCGTLNALYDTTMKIASGVFPLEDFERKHVLDSVNTKTGLVASSKKQKKEIEGKYDIKGQVMVVPKADPVKGNPVKKYANAIKRFSSLAS